MKPCSTSGRHYPRSTWSDCWSSVGIDREKFDVQDPGNREELTDDKQKALRKINAAKFWWVLPTQVKAPPAEFPGYVRHLPPHAIRSHGYHETHLQSGKIRSLTIKSIILMEQLENMSTLLKNFYCDPRQFPCERTLVLSHKIWGADTRSDLERAGSWITPSTGPNPWKRVCMVLTDNRNWPKF